MGKGFVLAPPKTVWDAVRNPRTRFTYDETLKKVDILETIGPNMKIGKACNNAVIGVALGDHCTSHECLHSVKRST